MRFDKATLLNVAFSSFSAAGDGTFKYAGKNVSAKLDFKKGILEAAKQKVSRALVNTRDGVDVEIAIGAAVAVDHFQR